MNRKGLTTTHLLGGIIAIFILIMVIFFIFGKDAFGTKISNFVNDLPFNFGKTNVVSGEEIIRYGIANVKLQYYTGTSWMDIKSDNRGLFILGNKKLVIEDETGTGLTSQIENFYYNTPRDENKKLIKLSPIESSKIRDKIGEKLSGEGIESAELPLLDAKISRIFSANEGKDLRGAVAIGFVSKSSPYDDLLKILDRVKSRPDINAAFNLLLKNDNHLLAEATDQGAEDVSTQSVYSSIASGAVNWRDSILKGGDDAKTMPITFQDIKIEEVSTCRYYVEKIEQFLVIRLNEPVGSCS